MPVQFFNNSASNVLTWTEQGGALQTPFSSNVFVYAEGQLLDPSLTPPAYTIALNTGVGESEITIDANVHVQGANYIVIASAAIPAVFGSGLDCLENLVGLSRLDCDCFPDAPVDWDTSTSGYYVDEPEYGYPIKDGALASGGCGAGSLWDIFSRSRSEAIRDLKDDLRSVLAKERTDTFYRWSGVMGDVKGNRTKTITRDRAGLLIQPKKRAIDGVFVITAIYAGFSHTGSIDVEIVGNELGATATTITLQTQSGRFARTALDSPLVLPLYDQAVGSLTYSLSYASADGIPINNRGYCGGCGGRPGWVQHLNVGGWERDIDPLETANYWVNVPCNNEFRGLAVEGYFDCMSLDFLCRLSRLGDAYTLSLLGRALQYKTAIKLMMADQTSVKVNQFTLLNAEGRAARIKAFQESYFNILLYVAQNAPSGASSCWGCGRRQPMLAAQAV